MKVAAVSELKAKLAKFLRLVKAGEEIEIQDRGVPVAILSAKKSSLPLGTVAPRKAPSRLASLHFSVKLDPHVDVVDVLMQDRKKR